ncbi:hypothetical protein JCM19232_2350 [Vibrio ishigakensis]|uniref:BIG2 domain-containing protein n=1 Tax=Vibrio ishigakensis TaxID=1481914 RepID=A0A0B8PB03_9VIBR|nr:hypothetical protein JCM19232_2350 [Vibrio ishigakensis]
MKAMFTKNTLLLSAIIAATLGLAGCNDSSSSSSTQSGEGDISLNVEESWEAEKNVTYDVVATNDGDPGKINWSVSDESILEISSIEQGGAVVRVKALDYGTATIKASIDNGNAIESEVKVEGYLKTFLPWKHRKPMGRWKMEALLIFHLPCHTTVVY